MADEKGLEPWREGVLRGMLTVAAIVAPPLGAFTLFGRSSPPNSADSVMVVFVMLSLIALRIAPALRTGTRALLAIGLLFAGALFFLARSGFVPGVAVILATTSVLAVIFMGRAFGFLFIGLSIAAFVGVGWLVTRGTLSLSAGDLDPLRMRNWVRMSLTTASVTVLLTLAVDFVMRQVQANARAATSALVNLQKLEAERQRGQTRWQRGAEELIALGRGAVVESGDAVAAFRALCEAGARGLEVDRCSVWLLDDAAGAIRCESLFERPLARHTSGLVLTEADAPEYFAALREARSLAVEDARTDPRTRQLAPYFEANDIGALLDAPIRFGDRLAGVVCNEHVGATRVWSREAQSFAASIADFAARALAAADRSAKERDLRAAYDRLGALHLRLEAAKEEERRFLAHELHDELGQTLTALKLRLHIDGRRLAGPAAAAYGGEQPVEAVALVDNLIARVRKMSVDLRPPLLDEVGLVPALRAYLESQSALSGVAMTLDASEADLDGASQRLPVDLEIVCFRVVQESVTNALRHASAQHLNVQMQRAAAQIRLSVRDDGRGFDPASILDAAAADGHLGVVGMRERVRGRGGEFRLSSVPGAGTTVEVELPITAAGIG
jgi:signal transduction histidine kinase